MSYNVLRHSTLNTRPSRRAQIEKLINGSLTCKQELFYACRRSRLLNTPVRPEEPFEPFSWWVSRNNEIMDYWGGSQPGSRKCACGILGTCIDRTKDCNCDAGERGGERGRWE